MFENLGYVAADVPLELHAKVTALLLEGDKFEEASERALLLGNICSLSPRNFPLELHAEITALLVGETSSRRRRGHQLRSAQRFQRTLPERKSWTDRRERTARVTWHDCRK